MGDIQQLPDAGDRDPNELGSGPVAPAVSTRLKNWAEDENVRNRIKQEIVPLIRDMYSRRQPLNDLWGRLFKVWSLEHDIPGYMGRSNVYVPAGRKALDTNVTQLMEGTFPSDDNFSVRPRSKLTDPRLAQDLKEMLKWRVEVTANVPSKAERFYRQLAITGNSPVKIHYVRNIIPGVGQRWKKQGQGFDIDSQDIVLYDGPAFETISATSFYVFPENVDDLDKATVVFEDVTITLATLWQRAAQGHYRQEAVDQCENGMRTPQKDIADYLRVQGQGFSSPHNEDRPVSGHSLVDIVEAYVMFDPTAEDKKKEKRPVPCLMTLAPNGEVLRCIRNPYWHQLPPYLLGRIGGVVGRFYGTGMAEPIRDLNVLLNDQVNQSMDAATLSLMPMLVVNQSAIQGALVPVEPGAVQYVEDVDAFKWFTPPQEVIQSGSILMTQTAGWINDYAMSPPVLQGGSSPGRAFRTATGIGTAQQNAKAPLQQIVRQNENSVWKRMLFMFYALDQQYAEGSVMVPFGDKDLREVDPRTLAGDWAFEWMASTQIANQLQRAQMIQSLIQMGVSPAVGQNLQANGAKFNVVPLAKRLIRESYGIREADEIIVTQDAPPGAPANPLPVPEEQAESPEEEATEGPEDEMENQNPEFGAVRQGADDLSSALGGLGGSMGVGSGNQT